jgi:hypothetical protein
LEATMQRQEITAAEAEIEKQQSFISFQFRTPEKWIQYFVMPFSMFIIETSLPEDLYFPNFKAERIQCETIAEWNGYYQKLCELKKKYPAIAVKTQVPRLQFRNCKSISKLN